MRWWQKLGLNFKAAFGISATMVIALGIVFITLSQYFRASLWQSEIQKTENINSIAESLLVEAMMSGRKDQLQETLHQLGQSVSNHQLYSIAVYDDDYRLTSFASGFPGTPSVQKSSMPTSIEDPTCWGCHQLPPAERPSHLVVTVEGRQVIRNSIPLYNEERCQSCHGTEKQILGDIMVDFSQEQFQQGYSALMVRLGGGLAAAVLLVAVVLYQVLRQIVLKPIEKVVEVAEAVSHGDLNRQIEGMGGDEIGALAKAFNSMISQLHELIGTLESRVAERTKALQTSAEVSRRLSTMIEQDQLVREVVEQIQAAFGYYHAHIYLFDSHREHLVLAGGTGEAGRLMLERGHRVQRGRGLVGRAADTNMPVVVADVSLDANWLPNPLLPETRSEAAIPVALGEEVLGVLDVQHNVVNAFQATDVQLLESLANQVAIAIRNARAYEASRRKAQREAMVASIGQQIFATTSIEDALKVAVRELGRATGAPETVVRVNVD